jgi:hypothetical protein
MRIIQDLRRESGCRVSDRVYCQWSSADAELSRALRAFSKTIAEGTGLSAFIEQRDAATLTIERTVDLEPGKPLWIGIRN